MYTTTILAPCNQISLFIFVFYDDDDDTYLFIRYPCLIFDTMMIIFIQLGVC